MKRGEVWWVDFEPAMGSEVRKTRPAVIVSNDASNGAIGITSCTINFGC
jgi:mRNA interferase MazF